MYNKIFKNIYISTTKIYDNKNLNILKIYNHYYDNIK